MFYCGRIQLANAAIIYTVEEVETYRISVLKAASLL